MRCTHVGAHKITKFNFGWLEQLIEMAVENSLRLQEHTRTHAGACTRVRALAQFTPPGGLLVFTFYWIARIPPFRQVGAHARLATLNTRDLRRSLSHFGSSTGPGDGILFRIAAKVVEVYAS